LRVGAVRSRLSYCYLMSISNSYCNSQFISEFPLGSDLCANHHNFRFHNNFRSHAKRSLSLLLTFRSYTQAGIFTTKPPTSCCISNIRFPVNKVPRPCLRVDAVMCMAVLSFNVSHSNGPGVHAKRIFQFYLVTHSNPFTSKSPLSTRSVFFHA